jgi:hypothetical protein
MSREPLKHPYTTPEMERLALSLGAYKVTVWSWRRRGVPLSWQIKLHQASKGKIKLTDFKRPKHKVN